MDRQCCLVETPRWKPPGGFPPQNGGNPPLYSYYDIRTTGGGFPPQQGGNPPPMITQWAKIPKKVH